MRCERGSVDVALPRRLPFEPIENGGRGMRIIGLDIHRAFAEAVAWKDGKLGRMGRVIMRRYSLEAFAKQPSQADGVVIEATGNAASVAAAIGPQVAALRQRLFARGVNRRRSDASAAPPSDPAQPDRAAALTAEERHPVDPARSSDPVLPASGSARACGPRLALGADPARRRAPGGGASPARVRPAGRRSPGWATISK